MKCPECVNEGEKSIVRNSGGTFTTAMPIDTYYDEDGNRHVHDDNVRTTPYSCSRGHKWVDERKPSCWCGEGRDA